MRGYGQRIKELRIFHKISQKVMAEKMEIAQSSLSDMENSIWPPLNRINQFCEIIKIPLYEFFIEEESKLESWLPSYIKPEDAQLLKILNTQISQERRIEIKKIYLDILKSHMLTAGEQWKE